MTRGGRRGGRQSYRDARSAAATTVAVVEEVAIAELPGQAEVGFGYLRPSTSTSSICYAHTA